MAKEFSKEQRKKELSKYYQDMDKKDYLSYLLDDKELESEFGVKKFIPDPGSVFLSILPRWEDPKFFMEIWVHYNIGVNNSSFLCPNKMFDDTCPICQYVQELKDAGEPDEVVSPYWYTRRILLWVVNAESKRSVAKGVYIYDAPGAVLKGILGQVVDERSGEVIDISDSKEEKNIVFRRTGKALRTRYESFKLEDMEFDIPEEYYSLPEMSELLIEPDIEKMGKLLGAGEPTEKSEKKEEKEHSRFKKHQREESDSEPESEVDEEESPKYDEEEVFKPRKRVEREPEETEEDENPEQAKKDLRFKVQARLRKMKEKEEPDGSEGTTKPSRKFARRAE